MTAMTLPITGNQAFDINRELRAYTVAHTRAKKGSGVQKYAEADL